MVPSPPPYKYASICIGAFLCLLTAVSGETTTPDWQQEQPARADIAPTPKQAPGTQGNETYKANLPATPDYPVRFLSYNLRNYLTMSRIQNGKTHNRFKPKVEIDALISIIKKAKPDILGVCEIGTENDLRDLKSRLKEVGVNLPHSHRTYGSDQARSLAILSRFPISSWKFPRHTDYKLSGRTFRISRGILDVTIQLPDKKVRFIGCHLKSKRPVKQADQELMRRNESMLLRRHIDSIIKATPNSPFIVYGDFNDSKRSNPLYTVTGRQHSKNRLHMLELTDSRGERWTHHWAREDIYSRFDYVMINKVMTPFIATGESRILDPGNWEKASDHRPLLVLIKRGKLNDPTKE